MINPHLLLIHPYIHDFSAYDLWMKPLGLYWLAGYLREHGYKVSILDCLDRYHPLWLASQGIKKPKGRSNGCGPLPSTIIQKPKIYAPILRYYRRFGIPVEIFRQLLKEVPTPRAILITSMMTYWYPGVFETIGLIKEVFPKIPMALGGVYATLCPEHAQGGSGVDKVFIGPGEVQVLKWLDSLDGTVREYPADEVLSGEYLPMPAHDLLSPGSSAAIATSLGCPFHCSYCASGILQPRFRRRPVENVVKEILYLSRSKHVHNIAFYDDALLVDAENHIIPIFQTILQKPLPVRFHMPNGLHSFFITETLAKILLQVRAETLRFSYERKPIFSPEAESRIEDENLEHAIECFRKVEGDKKTRIEVYVKAGLPDQSVEEIIEGFLFVHKLGARIKFTDYSPVPGTPDFFKIMQKYGLDTKEPLYQNNTTLPYFMGYSDAEFLTPLKSLVNTLNYALDCGINLTDSSRLSRLFISAAKKIVCSTGHGV